MAGRPFVVGLGGIPWSGKTTLMAFLLREFRRAEAVSYDKFHPGLSEAEVGAWLSRGGEPDELALSGLIGELTRLTEIRADCDDRPLVFFETAFGRAHRASGAFIDFMIWIDTPLDIALARAGLVFVADLKTRRAPDAAVDFVKWLARYMGDYPLLRGLYLKLAERVPPTADLVIDGTRPAEMSALTIMNALAGRGIAP